MRRQAVGKLLRLFILSFVISFCLSIFIFLLFAFRTAGVLSRALTVVFKFVGKGLLADFFAVFLFDIG